MQKAEQLRYQTLKRCTRICLWLNVFLMTVKLFYGHTFYSRALFADGIHSLLDVTADLFVIYAISIASKPEDECHPYGYSKYETLANIVISLLLLSASLAIMWDAVNGLAQESRVIAYPVAVVAILSIVLNEASYRYVRHYGKKLHSDLLVSTAVHQRADAATSLIVLISAVSTVYGIKWADITGAVIISILIAYYAIPSFIKGIGELLDKALSHEQLNEIQASIQSVSGVVDYHFLRTRSMASKGYIDLHIVVDSKISVSEGHYIGDQVKKALLEKDFIRDVTVHVDAEDDQEDASLLPSRDDISEWLSEQQILNDLSHFIIHYLDDKVELELYLKTNKPIIISRKPKWLKSTKIYHLL